MTPQPVFCDARLAVGANPAMGFHICILAAGHDGPHECDACTVSWRDNPGSGSEATATNEEG